MQAPYPWAAQLVPAAGGEGRQAPASAPERRYGACQPRVPSSEEPWPATSPCAHWGGPAPQADVLPQERGPCRADLHHRHQPLEPADQRELWV